MSPHFSLTQLSPCQSLTFLRASSSPGRAPHPAPAATGLGSGWLFPIHSRSPPARALLPFLAPSSLPI